MFRQCSVRIPKGFITAGQLGLPQASFCGIRQIGQCRSHVLRIIPDILQREGHVWWMGLLANDKMSLSEAANRSSFCMLWTARAVLAVKSSHILDTFVERGFHFGHRSS